MANRFLSNIRINDAYTFPASDGLAGQAIITDGAGNLSFGSVSGGGGATSSVVYRENFTGDGTTTDFQLTRNITDENITQIYLDGIYQEKDAYEIIDFDTIRFSAAPPSGHSIEVLYFYAIDAIPQPSTSVIYRDNFTGDGSTTDFTLANSISNEDYTQIYIDGAYQEKDTYTVTGTTLSFTTAPISGHSVEVISIAGLTTPYSPTTIYQDNFTGDGTTVAFTMQNAVDDEVKTMVYFNGVYQFKGTYTLDGVTITFDTAPASGVEIEVITIASAEGFEYEAQKILFYGKASEAITKGDAVMFAGQEGDHFLLAKATQAAISSNHEYFLGLANETLAQGEFGYVVEFGTVSEIDTTAYTAGDILWFDAGGSTAGALTTTEPAAPLVKIQVAAVVRSHQNEGVLFVRPTWYHELGELHDVNITSVADKDLLVWDAANGYWENGKTVDTLTGNTFSATTLTGTLSGGAQPNITSLGTLSSLNVTGNVGVGTSSPDATLHIVDTGLSVNSGILVQDKSTDATSKYGQIKAAHYSNSEEPMTMMFASMGATSNSLRIGGSYSAENASTEIVFYTAANNTTVSGSERMRIDSSGNVIVGSTTANNVNASTLRQDGTAHVNNLQVANAAGSAGGTTPSIYSPSGGQLAISLNSAERLRIDGSGNVGIGTSSPKSKLDIKTNTTTGTIAATSSIVLTNRDNGEATNKTLVGGVFADMYRDVASPAYAAGIWFERKPIVGNASSGGEIVFGSQGNATSALPTEVARFTLNGLTFNGDTAAANALDDYEEGSWTPTAGTSISITSILNATYTKIGNIVTVQAWIKADISSSTFTLTGLPHLAFGRGAAAITNGTIGQTIGGLAINDTIYGYGATVVTYDDIYISATYRAA